MFDLFEFFIIVFVVPAFILTVLLVGMFAHSWRYFILGIWWYSGCTFHEVLLLGVMLDVFLHSIKRLS